jgi:hypothetical protein
METTTETQQQTIYGINNNISKLNFDIALNGRISHLSYEHINNIETIIKNTNQLSAIITAERSIYNTLTDEQKDNGENHIDIILEKLEEIYNEYFGINNLNNLYQKGLQYYFRILINEIENNNNDNKYGTAIIGFILIGATLPVNDNRNKLICKYTTNENNLINLTFQSLSENILKHIDNKTINELCIKMPNFELYNFN